jgi:hypothetical protein
MHDYGSPVDSELALNEFAYSGVWNVAPQPASAIKEAEIAVQFQAKNVYLVLSSSGEKPRGVRVLLDGHPIPNSEAGADVHDGVLTVRGQRLYSLVSLPSSQRHQLTLVFSPGVSGYAFTFG